MGDEIGRVYHYTSISALLNIVGKRMFWASHLSYLNDATEGVYGRTEVLAKVGAAADRVRAEQPKIPAPDPSVVLGYQQENDPEWWVKLLNNLVEFGGSQSSNSPYILSFTELPDALSQWRGYGNIGCAIGVNPYILVEKRDGFDLDSLPVRMLYGDGGLAEAAEAIISLALDRTVTSVLAEAQRKQSRALQSTALELARLKHEGFSEEKEVRLVFASDNMWMAIPPPIPKYRPSPTGLLIPYLEVPINLAAIETIHIGPGPHRKDNLAAVQGFVSTIRYAQEHPAEDFNPEVTASDTPFK